MTDDGKKKIKKGSEKPGFLKDTLSTPDTRHPPPETGGPKGPEPTRYGDWEIGGKCVDF
jgi:hypothetical protein